MKIIDCQQRTEEWDRWRDRPTASEFGSLCTPVRGDYSKKQADAYAAKIVSKRLGVYVEPPPSFWMDWGCTHEPNAKAAYTLETGREITEVGFCLPDGTDAYGCSPDALVGEDGLLEVKCPAPETLIRYIAADVLPVQYRPQIQGQLLITGREWCDFYAFHPELTPFLLRVEADVKYQTKIAKNLLTLLKTIDHIESKVRRMHHPVVATPAHSDKVRFAG